MTRRTFLLSSALAASASAKSAEITVGITSNTRPEWAGPEGFLRSLEESSELGYHWIETFWPYVNRWALRG